MAKSLLMAAIVLCSSQAIAQSLEFRLQQERHRAIDEEEMWREEAAIRQRFEQQGQMEEYNRRLNQQQRQIDLMEQEQRSRQLERDLYQR